MRRLAIAVVVVAAVAAACGDGGALFTVADSSATGAPGPTEAPSTMVTIGAPSTSAAAPVTSAPEPTAGTAPAAGVDLTVIQVLARIDGGLPVGTFDATVCNLGEDPSGPYVVTISANGVEVVVEGQAGVEPRGCVDAFDPAVTFTEFAVAAGDSVAVAATVVTATDGDPGNDRYETTTVVGRTTPGPDDPHQMEIYDSCRQGGEHRDCTYALGVSPMADPREILKMRDGWAAVVPAEFEPIASQVVATMDICFAELEEFLGIHFYEPFAPLPWRFMVGDMAFNSHYTGIDLVQDGAYLQGIVDGAYDHFQWSNILDGTCQEAHEPTHVMVAETPIPGWINEGLAVYDSNPDRSYWYDDQRWHRCEEDGYVEINPWMDTETFHPYARLEGGWDVDGREAGDYYTTGACFWEWFGETYGHEALQGVLRALADDRRVDYYRSSDLCEEFLPAYVEPVIGEDISAITEERFGFGNTYDCYSR